MQDLYTELRTLRERLEDLDRRMESRIQDDGGASSSKPDVLRYIKFPLGGIGGQQSAKVDYYANGWQTGKNQISVVFRGPNSVTVGQGTDPRTGTNRTGYAAWNYQTASWDVIQEFC
jgi:hypothetical protein